MKHKDYPNTQDRQEKQYNKATSRRTRKAEIKYPGGKTGPTKAI